VRRTDLAAILKPDRRRPAVHSESQWQAAYPARGLGSAPERSKMASAARPARGSSQNVTATGEGELPSAWKSLSPGRGRPRIGAAPKLVRLVFSKLPSPAITENLTDQSRIRNNFVIAPRTAVLSPMAEAGPLPRYPLLRPLAREGGGHRPFCLSAKVRYRCCSVAVLPDAIK
jgi:hypothetical protein